MNQLRGTGLKAKSARGVLILAFGNGLERLTRLVRNMILARLLAPEDFGLMAIVIATSVVIETFTDVGVRQAVIHYPEGDKRKYLNVAWWFQVLRAVFLFLIAYLVAPWISAFYEQPELTLFLRTSLITILFQGFISPRSFVLEKQLNFGRWILIGQGGAFLGSVLTVLLTFWLRNTWALVLGFISEAAFRCLISFLVCPFWPNFQIDRGVLKDLLKYIRGMIGVTFLSIISMQVDVFVLSKLLQPAQVGIYVMALNLARQPARLFRLTIATVLMPAFAKKQDNLKEICSFFLKISENINVFGIPFVIFAVIFSRFILLAVYGDQYTAATVPFSVLCISILFRMQYALCGTLYLALGKPNLHRHFIFLMVFVIVTAMYPAVKYLGLVGAASVLLLADVIGLALHVMKLPELISLQKKEYAKCWYPVAWLLPIMAWPFVVFGILGIYSFTLKVSFSIVGLFLSCYIYLRFQILREDTF